MFRETWQCHIESAQKYLLWKHCKSSSYLKSISKITPDYTWATFEHIFLEKDQFESAAPKTQTRGI